MASESHDGRGALTHWCKRVGIASNLKEAMQRQLRLSGVARRVQSQWRSERKKISGAAEGAGYRRCQDAEG